MQLRFVRITVLIAVFVAGSSLVWAGKAGYKDDVETFFDALRQGKSGEGLSKLYGTSPWLDNIEEQLTSLQEQLSALPGRVGAYVTHELLAEREIADRLVYLGYFVVFERQPLRFEFQFYRPKDEWVLYGFSLDDALPEELAAHGREQAIREAGK
jgi:hypothetical protein